MKRTSVQLQEDQLKILNQLSEAAGTDRSTVIRELLNSSLHPQNNYDNPIIASQRNVHRRLTESARHMSSAVDAIAYSYAGALQHLEQDKMIALATQQYSQNPLAHRLIEIISDFCVGDRITWETNDEVLWEYLNKFWTHPRNALDKTQHRIVSELLLYGEQCYPAFVNAKTGLVQLGNIHPAFIKQTVLDPEHCSFIIGVEMNNSLSRTTTYRTILGDDPEEFLNAKALEMRRDMVGDCFYFAINTLSLPTTAAGINERSYQNRGRSVLLPLIDRIGMLDDLNYLNLDRAQIILGVIYELTINQASAQDIKRVVAEFGSPQGPTVRAHDEKTKIDIVTPKLGATETASLFKMIQDEILGGSGIPPHWFAEGGGANRATAMSMELPTLKMLNAKQTYVAEMFKVLLDYQVLMLKKMGKVDEDAEYTLNVPAITRKDMVIIGDTLNKTVVNLEKAVANKWITPRKAGEIFREIASGYGVELSEPEDFDEYLQQLRDQEQLAVQSQQSLTDDADKEKRDSQTIRDNDRIGVDNPDEPREEKNARDLENLLSTEGRYK